ncbi:MAG: hypothetical protein QM766_18390 [Burkholderiaceae bacterium]
MRSRGIRFGIGVVATAIACAAGMLHAQDAAPAADSEWDVRLDEACPIPDELRYSEAELPRFAARLEAAKGAGTAIPVIVVGAGSSAGAGLASPGDAYPMRLRDELHRRFPALAFDVRVLARRGDKVSDMLRRLRGEIVPQRPALLIWQIGAADAVSGVPINAFGRQLSQGIELVHGAGIDLVLMDMQYSPFTDMLINAREYRGYIRWIAKREKVPLLRRYEMMEAWAEQELIDLSSRDADTRVKTAQKVHACVAGRLAQLIRDVVDAAPR